MAVSSPSVAVVDRNGRFHGLTARILSALVLGPAVLAAIWIGFPWIDLLAAIAAPIMVWEWAGLTRGRPLARGLSFLYTLAAIVALLWLRHQPDSGRQTVLWVMACVWAADIGAYVLGSIAGGAKLAPRISPSKTWSGLVGGMCFASVTSAFLGLVFQLGETVSLALIGVVLAIVDQAGDLLESAAKRRAGVKDSGRLIPGHGGLLDRVDGLMACLIVAALLRLCLGGGWPWA